MLHLVHPAVVHVTVAFLAVGGTLEALGYFARKDELIRFGGTLMVIGTLALVPTLATGYLAANSLTISEDALKVLADHERNGWILLGVSGVALFWKGYQQGRLPDRQRTFYALLLLAVVGLTIYSSFLGGDMVYGHGVGMPGSNPSS